MASSGGPPRRRRRGLSDDDLKLWSEVTRHASPLHGTARLRGSTTLSEPAPEAVPAPPQPKRPRPKAPKPAAPRDPVPVRRGEPGLDRRTAERLRRGMRDPDARIDLHGMTAERAHAALDAFLDGAAGRGARLLLVITGKGAGRGVLRDAVPGWLRAGRHGPAILALYQAHQRHGGAGALYVYLRKPR